jgi:hypothetical protein
MKKVLIVLAVVAFGIGLAGISTAAVVDLGTYGGHSYELVVIDGGLTWTSANTAAGSLGGYLATITSAGEQAFIAGALNSIYTDSLTVHFWIGGSQTGGDTATPGQGADYGWNWVTGETWSFTSWASGMPNDSVGGSQDYLQIGSEWGWNWDDSTVTDGMIGYRNPPVQYGYVLEKVPEPSTLILLGSGLLGLVGYGRKRMRK